MRKVSRDFSYKGFDDINPEVLRMLENMNARNKSSKIDEAYAQASAASSRKIALRNRNLKYSTKTEGVKKLSLSNYKAGEDNDCDY